jgi:hypothetical protein
LRYLARRLRPSFSLFLLSLACFWPSDSPSYSRALEDMLDSDSFKDLTSDACGGISGDHRTIKTSRVCTASMSALLELLMSYVEASVL